MARRKNPMIVEVLSGASLIGKLEVADFMEACRKMGASSNMFLPAMIQQFNAIKERAGEPERVRCVLRG